MWRGALLNRIHGLLAEFGMVVDTRPTLWRMVSGTFRWRNKEDASGQGELFLTLFAKGIMVHSNGCVHPYHWASATTAG